MVFLISKIPIISTMVSGIPEIYEDNSLGSLRLPRLPRISLGSLGSHHGSFKDLTMAAHTMLVSEIPSHPTIFEILLYIIARNVKDPKCQDAEARAIQPGFLHNP